MTQKGACKVQILKNDPMIANHSKAARNLRLDPARVKAAEDNFVEAFNAAAEQGVTLSGSPAADVRQMSMDLVVPANCTQVTGSQLRGLLLIC